MKLTTKLLKKLIKEEIQRTLESQVYPNSGLKPGFGNLKFSEKVYDEIDAYEQSGDDTNLWALRKTALDRYRKLKYDISQADSFEEENLNQELVFLDGATDALDLALKLFRKKERHGPESDSDIAAHGLSPEGHPLERRAKQRDSKLSKSYHKEYTKDKGW